MLYCIHQFNRHSIIQQTSRIIDNILRANFWKSDGKRVKMFELSTYQITSGSGTPVIMQSSLTDLPSLTVWSRRLLRTTGFENSRSEASSESLQTYEKQLLCVRCDCHIMNLWIWIVHMEFLRVLLLSNSWKLIVYLLVKTNWVRSTLHKISSSIRRWLSPFVRWALCQPAYQYVSRSQPGAWSMQRKLISIIIINLYDTNKETSIYNKPLLGRANKISIAQSLLEASILFISNLEICCLQNVVSTAHRNPVFLLFYSTL